MPTRHPSPIRTRSLACAALLAVLLAVADVATQSRESPRLVGSIVLQEMAASGATVELRRDNEGPPVASTVTDEFGRFSLLNSQTGKYLLRISWGWAYAQRVVHIAALDTLTVDVRSPSMCHPSPLEAGQLDDESVAEIVRLALVADGVLSVGGNDASSSSRNPLVFNDRLPRAWQARVADLGPLSRRRLQQRAARAGSASYTTVWDVHPAIDCPTVTIANDTEIDARAKKTGVSFAFGSRTYRFTRRGDEWEFDLVGSVEE